MTSHDGGDLDGVEKNPYASSSRWRHQESSAFHRHAAPQPRDPQERNETSDIADFLNRDRVEPDVPPDASQAPKFKPVVIGAAEAKENIQHAHSPSAADAGVAQGSDHAAPAPAPAAADAAAASDGKDIVCGPLLNYRKMDGNTWYGSALIVTQGGGKTLPAAPVLHLRRVGRDEGQNRDSHHHTAVNNATTNGEAHAAGADGDVVKVQGECLYSDPRNTFWAFGLAVEMEQSESKWEYWFPDMRFISQTKPKRNSFFVPALNESMRIMFHSCNGFSVGTDVDAFSGQPLWNDVGRRHAEAPLHVMYALTLPVYPAPCYFPFRPSAKPRPFIS